jgi:hypothetical protein
MFGICSSSGVVAQETSKPKTKQNKANLETNPKRLASSIVLSSSSVIGESGFSGLRLAQNGEIGQNGLIVFHRGIDLYKGYGSISWT